MIIGSGHSLLGDRSKCWKAIESIESIESMPFLYEKLKLNQTYSLTTSRTLIAATLVATMPMVIELLSAHMAYLIAMIAVEVISLLELAKGSATAIVDTVLMMFQLKPTVVSIQSETVLLCK